MRSFAPRSRSVQIGLAFALLTYYWTLLRIWPRMVLRGAAQFSFSDPAGDTPSQVNLAPTLSAVERAAELHPLRPRCLERALAAERLLAWAGEPAHVVIGVNRSSDRLTAHAWVEINGVANDAARSGFVSLSRLR